MSYSYKFMLLAACLLGCMSGYTFAQDESSESKKDSTAQSEQKPEQEEESLKTFEDFEKYFSNEMKAYMKRYRVAPTKAEKQEEYANRPKIKPFQERLTELINSSSVSEETRKGVTWWYKKAKVEDHQAVVLRLILENFPEAEFMEEHIYKLAYDLSQADAEKYLRSILDVNTFNTARARAIYQLRDILNKKVGDLDGEKAEMVKTELESLKNTLMTKHADAKNINGINLLEMVEGEEFASKLQIGKPVPDIIGEDIDGVEFKLSDYKGKVTMISFWGFW